MLNICSSIQEMVMSLNYLSQTDRYSHSMLSFKHSFTIVVLANLAPRIQTIPHFK